MGVPADNIQVTADPPAWYHPGRAGAFVVDRELPPDTLLRAARGIDRKLVTEIRLFDVYEGAGLAEGKKSLVITVVLQPQERTLTDAEIRGVLEAPDRSGRKGHRRPAARAISPGIPLFHGEKQQKAAVQALRRAKSDLASV
jgi:hypothetical protein